MGCEGEICARPDLEPPEGMERIVAGPAAIDGRLVAPLRHHITAASALSITASRHHASPPSHYYHYSGKQPPRTLRARFAINGIAASLTCQLAVLCRLGQPTTPAAGHQAPVSHFDRSAIQRVSGDSATWRGPLRTPREPSI
jgi:hypothetical protein